jgi:SAM-dependent methyltransferase
MNLAMSLYAQKYRLITTPGREQVLCAMLQEHLPGLRSTEVQVLDVGCGVGHITAAIAAKGYAIQGIDSSAEMLAEARRLYRAIPFEQADLRQYRAVGRFDAIVCLGEVFNQLSSSAEFLGALCHLRSLLAPGARLIAETLDPQDLQANWENATQLFTFEDGWVALFDYKRVGNRLGQWTARWVRAKAVPPEAESHSLELLLQTWTPNELSEMVAAAGFVKPCVLDLWRGGVARMETVSQLLLAEAG